MNYLGKRRFTAKQRAAQRLFAKRARSGAFKRKARAGRDIKWMKRNKLCFSTVIAVAAYMRRHGYRVTRK